MNKEINKYWVVIDGDDDSILGITDNIDEATKLIKYLQEHETYCYLEESFAFDSIRDWIDLYALTQIVK